MMRAELDLLCQVARVGEGGKSGEVGSHTRPAPLLELTEGEIRMAARQRMTVSPAQGKGGWTLSIAGAGENTYRTKAEAVKAGASKGRQNGHAQLVIKGRNGRIQSERTYGADPRRTKG
jgi:hypothetical protein